MAAVGSGVVGRGVARHRRGGTLRARRPRTGDRGDHRAGSSRPGPSRRLGQRLPRPARRVGRRHARRVCRGPRGREDVRRARRLRHRPQPGAVRPRSRQPRCGADQRNGRQRQPVEDGRERSGRGSIADLRPDRRRTDGGHPAAADGPVREAAGGNPGGHRCRSGHRAGRHRLVEAPVASALRTAGQPLPAHEPGRLPCRCRDAAGRPALRDLAWPGDRRCDLLGAADRPDLPTPHRRPGAGPAAWGCAPGRAGPDLGRLRTQPRPLPRFPASSWSGSRHRCSSPTPTSFARRSGRW